MFVFFAHAHTQIFDKNQNGFIEPEELRATMRELGMTLRADDIEFMMEQANCKIPGRIYYEGTCTCMCMDDKHLLRAL